MTPDTLTPAPSPPVNHIDVRQLACGATLVVEQIETVASAAITWLLPVGAASDPLELDGQAAMLSEIVFRGAGDLDSRAFSDAMDRLGAQRSAHVTNHHLRLGATCLATRAEAVLDMMALMVRRPAMADDALEPVRSLCLQSLDALPDDPQHQVMLSLREQHFPAPYNRNCYGRRESLERITIDTLRETWAARCRPGGTIIAVAGNVDPATLARCLDRSLEGWTGAAAEPEITDPPRRGWTHMQQETAQVHVALGYDAPAEPDDNAMVERVSIGVLSGGTSARLFTEVRQKRSLCYSVGASYRGGRDRGMVAVYAGTTPQRAQETIDVTIEQIRHLCHGVSAEELHRATTGLKSQLIMQGESTAARAATIAADQYRLGRPRTLAELGAAVDAITVDQVNAYLAARSIGPLTAVWIGPVPLVEPSP